MEKGNISLEWTKVSDTPIVGDRVAQIIVTDKLDVYIQNKIFNKNVKVTEEKLTADPVSQLISLGMDTSKIVEVSAPGNVKFFF